MTKYEIMYILKANLEDADRNQLIGKLHEILVAEGGSVESVNEWGIRDFAYEINGDKKGYYVVANIEVENTNGIEEFKRITRINPNVVRSLIIAK